MTTDDKINAIYKDVTDIKVSLATALVHQENHAKDIRDHKAKFEIVEAERNQSIGKKVLYTGAFGIVCSAIGAGFRELIKHL